MEGARDPFRRPISPTAMTTQTAKIEQAVDADEDTLGAKHPDTLTARAALARCYLFSGRSTEAVTSGLRHFQPASSPDRWRAAARRLGQPGG